MESIVIQELLVAVIEESGLWELHWAVNTIFPENDMGKNLTIAMECIIWLRDKMRITFYSKNLKQEKLAIEYIDFLSDENNWKPQAWNNAVFAMTTDLGDLYYTKFEEKFWPSIEKNGFLRNGKRYCFTQYSFNILKKVQFRHVVRTLGIPSTTIDNNFVKHTDLFSHTQCIVDTRTNLITDILHVEN